MKTFKIASITHGEDIDGVGSQSIIYRYFEILKKPLIAELLSSDQNLSAKTKVEVICLRTDYNDYMYYWSAILAQNLSKLKSDSKFWFQSRNLNFTDRWKKISEDIIVNHIQNNNSDPLDKILPKTKENILHMAESLKEIDMVIITDLGVNQTQKKLHKILNDFNLEIAYFDHHTHDPESIKFFESRLKIYLNDENRCTSQIVKDFFLPEDEISQKIAFHAADSDFNSYKSQNSENFQLFLGRYMFDYDKIDLLRDCFVTGDFDNSKVKSLVEEAKKWEHIQENYLRKTYHKDVLEISGKKVEFVLCTSKLRPGRAVRWVQKNYNEIFPNKKEKPERVTPNLILAVNIDNWKMNIRSNTFNIHKVAKSFGGGGHSKRAGFVFPEEYFIQDEHEKKFINKIRINEFVDDIIKIIEQKGNGSK
jgi:nanoRNase/pAp phosphatase (c-di-AMP/oligoRNAs hydrolase)